MEINKRINNEGTPDRLLSDISLIVHHHTASSGDSENFLKRDDYISCHYLIKNSGEIVQLVDLNRIAYHAGISDYEGFDQKGNSLNWCSIGIEVEGGARGAEVDDFTNEQRISLKSLTEHLCSSHSIQRVLRHKDISPDRKVDPYDTLYHRGFEKEYNTNTMAEFKHDYLKIQEDEVKMTTVGHNHADKDSVEENIKAIAEIICDRKIKKIIEVLQESLNK